MLMSSPYFYTLYSGIRISLYDIIAYSLYTYGVTYYIMDEERIIPEEIDDHFKMYGKEPWEINYTTTKCSLCGSRFDEYGFCSCGASGE